MPLIRKVVALALGFALVSHGLIGCTEGGRRGLNPGDIAPKIEGTDLSGAPKSLYDIKGKAVVLNFWATWCAPCVTELPALQSLYDQLKDSGLVVVGVAVDDTAENIKEYQERFKLTFPIIVDSSSESKRAYELKGLPETFVLDQQHRILMIQDIGGTDPVSRLVGPREWSSPASLEILRGVLK